MLWEKSYYVVLGIVPGVSAGEIKPAYRLLAMEFHPDHYKGSSDIFREI